MGRGEKEKECMHAGEKVSEKALWLLLLYVFSSTWACPMQIRLSQECCLFCLFCLKSSLWSSDLPCLLATAILDPFSLFHLPNVSRFGLLQMRVLINICVQLLVSVKISFLWDKCSGVQLVGHYDGCIFFKSTPKWCSIVAMLVYSLTAI